MRSSTKIAFILSFSISAFHLLVLNAFSAIETQKLLLFCLVLFTFTFIIVKYSFKSFIKNRIKPIFKTIYEGEKLNETTDSLEDIQKDALALQRNKDANIYNLKQQINFRKEFLGNISHELKTPLFSAQGYIDTLLDGGLKDENINIAYLKKASKNIERLSTIVSDIDIISKIESNALKLNKTSFSISDLVTESIEDLELLADKNDITIHFKSNSNNLKTFSDREKIKEVLINLVSNSLKYGKEKGKTTISMFDIEDKVLVRIADNGIGIKKEQLPRVFERFYRIDDNRSRQQGGSGLGLAIVKHLIEAHSQTVSVQSEFGIGSTFEFTLYKD